MDTQYQITRRVLLLRHDYSVIIVIVMAHKPKHEITIRSAAAEYLTFVSTIGDQSGSVELRYEDENIWLTQRLMAELYGVDVRTINYHIKKILEDHELDENSVIRKYWITAYIVKTYKTNHYSLQLIITVGFKTNNERVSQVRR